MDFEFEIPVLLGICVQLFAWFDVMFFDGAGFWVVIFHSYTPELESPHNIFFPILQHKVNRQTSTTAILTLQAIYTKN